MESDGKNIIFYYIHFNIEEKKEGKQIKGKSGKQGLKDRVREE